MKINVDKSFVKDFKKIDNKLIQNKVMNLLKELESLNTFNEINNI